jgi:hypothetical protein
LIGSSVSGTTIAGEAGQRRDVVTRFQRHQHLFRPHDTDDFIQLAAADREQAVRRREQLTANFIFALLGVTQLISPRGVMMLRNERWARVSTPLIM